MDDKKKLAALVGVIVIAVAAVGFMMSKGAPGEEKPRAVGSLEEGVNKESGLPLNPPKNDTGGANPSGATADPSMPAGN